MVIDSSEGCQLSEHEIDVLQKAEQLARKRKASALAELDKLDGYD